MSRVARNDRVEGCRARQAGKSIAAILIAILLLLCVGAPPARAQTGPLWITNQGGYSGDCYDATGDYLGPTVPPYPMGMEMYTNDLGPNYPLPAGQTLAAWDNAWYDNAGPPMMEYTDPWNYTVTGSIVVANLTAYPMYVQMDLWMAQGYHTTTQLLVPNGGSTAYPFNGITALLPTQSEGYFYLTVTPLAPKWTSGPVLACSSVSFVTTEHN